MERLGPLDAFFLNIEDGISHMHIGACAVLEGPPPAYPEVVAAIGAKLDQAPRYRQVVRFVPFQLGGPSGSTTPTSTSRSRCTMPRCRGRAAPRSSTP